MPADAVLESAYADAASDDYVEEDAGQRETARRALARIERSRRNGARGDAARPRLLGRLPAGRGARARLGVDGRRAVAVRLGVRARRRSASTCVTGDLFTAPLPAASYDAVVMGDVIEHLPRPGEALDRIADAAARRAASLDGAPGRRQPPSRAGWAGAGGRSSRRTCSSSRATRCARCSSATAGPCSRSTRAEGLQRALLPRARRRLLAGRRAARSCAAREAPASPTACGRRTSATAWLVIARRPG